MPDTFTDQLSRLAPIVDATASRDLFDRARSTGSPTPRWWLAAAVVMLLVAGVVGVWAVTRDDDGTAPVAPVGDAFEVLAVVQSGQPVGTILVAGDRVALEQHLAVVGGLLPAVDVDFGESLVAMFAIAGNGCATSVDGFDVSANVWSARFASTDEPCDTIGLTWTSIVALDRAALAATAVNGQVVLRVDVPGEAQTDVVIDLDPPDAAFEVRLVEQTDEPYGELAAFDSNEALAWRLGTISRLGWTIDWDREIALVATMPDNACPDTLVRFDVDGDVWTPVFEEQATACEDPLLSWLYVVAIDRSALPAEVTFRIPADTVFDVPERTVTVSVTPTTGGPASPDAVTLEPTGVVVPLPPVGEPKLHVDTVLDPFWVVHHDDGTVSVLGAIVPASVDGDEGVTGLARLAVVAEDGRGFAADRWLYDDHGRTVNGPRSHDLVGFAGEVTDEGVAILRSDATRIAGEAGRPSSAGYRPADARAAIDLPTLMTLSYSGPIWRFLDATLVVEGGAGTICDVDTDGPVDRLATCTDGPATGVRSDQPAITTWFPAPLLAEFDELGRIGRVVPLGGLMSRNDAVIDGLVPVEPIAVVESEAAAPLRIVAETDAVELSELRDVDLSTVAWDDVHLLLVTIEGSGCPIRVTALSPIGDGRWTIEAEQQGTACRAELARWLNAVPVPRTALPSGAVIEFEGATITWP